jgi:hypothetical protein
MNQCLQSQFGIDRRYHFFNPDASNHKLELIRNGVHRSESYESARTEHDSVDLDKCYVLPQ